MQIVHVIDHEPEGTVGVVDTPHGGVGLPAEARNNEGRAMRPHNRRQPPMPPCYVPVDDDLDINFNHEHSSGPK